MKTPSTIVLALLLSLGVKLNAQPTAFTYQGRLNSGGEPANGIYDLRFDVFDASVGGTAAGPTVTSNKVPVGNGLFSVVLDFGSDVFTGATRWLEVSVCTNGAGAYTTLSPRQALTAAPYSFYALRSGSAGIAGSVQPGSITSAAFAPGAVTRPAIAPGAVSQLGTPDGTVLNAVQVDTNGWTGIGTNTPQAALHVSGGNWILYPHVAREIQNGMGWYTNLGGAWGLAVSSNLVAVAALMNGLTLVDASAHTFSYLWSTAHGQEPYTNLIGASSVAFSTNRLLAVAAEGSDAVTLLDVKTPTNPVWQATLWSPAGWNDLRQPAAVAFEGNLLAVAGRAADAVTLVDVSTPTLPIQRAVIRNDAEGFADLGAPAALAFRGNLLAIAALRSNAVVLADISDPSHPAPVAVLKAATGFAHLNVPWGVAFEGSLLAIAGNAANAVTLVDVSTPAVPVLRAVIQNGPEVSMRLVGPKALAFGHRAGRTLLAVSALHSSTLLLFDVTEPARPVTLGVYPSGQMGLHYLDWCGGLGFCASGDLAISSQGASAVTLVTLMDRQVGLVTDNWVGIGTTRPRAPLEVVGDTLVQGANLFQAQARHLELGYNAVAAGSDSVAIGLNTRATGRSSTALGVETLASGYASTTLGYRTTASGSNAIASGSQSTAAGAGSFAAGTRAKAMHDGAFVWSDYQPWSDFASTAPNQLLLRASGGVGIGTNRPQAALHVVGTVTASGFSGEGSGLWSLQASNVTGQLTAGQIAPGAISQLGTPNGAIPNAVQVDSTARVGVGTASPAAGLDVQTSGTMVAPAVLFQVRDDTQGYNNLNEPICVAATSNLVVVGSQSPGAFSVIDVSDPGAPVLRSQIQDGSGVFTNLAGVYGVALSGSSLAVAAQTESAVTLISLTNPAAPAKLSEIRAAMPGWTELGGAVAVAISRNIMAVAAYSSDAVMLVDISNPGAPVKLSVLRNGVAGYTALDGPVSLAISRDMLAIASFLSHAVTLVDVSNPAAPVKVAELVDGSGGFSNLGGVWSVAIVGRLLAIADRWTSAVTLVDLSDVRAPLAVIQVEHLTGEAHSVTLSGDWLAVAAGNISLFDVSEPSKPRKISWAPQGLGGSLLADPRAIAFANTNLAVADFRGAFLLLGFQPSNVGMLSRGWVGIGTTTPLAALDVRGDVLIENARFIAANADRIALGDGAAASSDGATAIGSYSRASGVGSTALGNGTTAGGWGATAAGQGSLASADSATAMGKLTRATAFAATALGNQTVASAAGATALGIETTASGQGSIATGLRTTASGNYAIAMGEATTASGFASTALGSYTTASGFESMALGDNAHATNVNAFVWSDGSAHFASTRSSQFLIRAINGVGINTNNPATALEVNGTITATRFTGNGSLPWQVVSGTWQDAAPDNGYLMTNESIATVRLPAAPEMGDIVRVSGIGASGWRITQNTGQSILTANFGQAAGNLWTPRASSSHWTCLASSADGSRLLAANGDLGEVYRSTDSGVTWARVLSGAGWWLGVASSADGRRLVAADSGPSMSNGGYMWASSDWGTTWASHGPVRPWSSVACSMDGYYLIAAGGDYLYTSSDAGTNWVPRGVSNKWYRVASSANGSKLVAACSPGYIYTSVDYGVSWTPRPFASDYWAAVTSSADGAKLAAAASDGQLYTSWDSGASWIVRISGYSFWRSLACSADGTIMIAAADNGRLHLSTNSGLNWAPRDSVRDWTAVACDADGNRMAAAVSVGLIYTSVPTTTPGSGSIAGAQFSAIELQYVGNNQFLPLNSSGTINFY